MVQVDIFWSYGIGAAFAAGAARQLAKTAKPFDNKFFTYTLIFLSCFFAPSGVYLLWQFPHWETMQVARTHTSIPAWLVVIFAITNITQGILGFWVTYRFIRKGNYYMAHLQWFLGHFLMFFILLHGWDGSGWQRFLYDPTVHAGVLWSPGTHDGIRFFISNVALTLYVMGIFIVPGMLVPIVRWIRQGAEMDTALTRELVPDNYVKTSALMLIGVFGVALGSAGLAALVVHLVTTFTGSLVAGFLAGVPLFIVLAHYCAFRRQRPVYHFFRQLFLAEPQVRS